MRSLSRQSLKTFRTVFVIKESGDGTEPLVRKLGSQLMLDLEIVTQTEGNVVEALELGLRQIDDELVLITDDDAILPSDWISKNVKLHKNPRFGAVSGNILSYDLTNNKVARLNVSKPLVYLYRSVIRPILDRPHNVFRAYTSGIYITKNYGVAAGKAIPNRQCLSLPCRGVNLSFKRESLDNVDFPKHPALRRCPWWEPYLGAQVVLNGWQSIYSPILSVYHIERESISRTRHKTELRIEKRIMKSLIKRCLQSSSRIGWKNETGEAS